MIDEEAWAAAQSGRPLPSPVPSDDDLWHTEKPFTAFGQFGENSLDLRCFDQDIWWADRLGRPHRLETMSTEYRRNVLAFLLDGASQYWVGSVLREAITAYTDALRGKASYAVLAPGAGAALVSELDPVTWLEGAPFSEAIHRGKELERILLAVDLRKLPAERRELHRAARNSLHQAIADMEALARQEMAHL